MKIFNVDELKKEERAIALGGKEHPVLDMSVEAYLKTMAISKDLEKFLETPEGKDTAKAQEAQIDALIKTVLISIPTLDADTLRNLPFEQMNAIAQFARGDVPDALKDAIKTEVQTEAVIQAEADAKKE